MSRALDTVTYTNLQETFYTHTPNTIIKFIANYIKRRKAYTTFRKYTSIQRQFKTGVPQGGVLTAKLFSVYIPDIPQPPAPLQLTSYADEIIITCTHTSKTQQKHTYNHIYNKYTHGQNITTSCSALSKQPEHYSHRPCRI